MAKASVWYLVALVADVAPTAAGDAVQSAGLPVGGGELDPPAALRVFRVTRLVDAALMDEPARRPAGFNLAAFWTRWCADFEAGRPRYPVALRVAPDFLHVLPQQLGEGVRATIAAAVANGDADGRGWLLVPLTFENLDTACVGVLGFGPAVEVVSPRDLRLRVAEQARGIASRYDEPAVPASPAAGVPRRQLGARRAAVTAIARG